MAARSRTWRRSTAASLIAAAGLLAAGCTGPETEIEPLRLGLLTEADNPDSEMTVQAARLAVAGVNAHGGLEVGGTRRPVELFVRDTGTAPEGATRMTLELINQDRVAALIGSNSSRTAIPEAAIADAARIPMISPGSTHPETTAGKPSAFRVTYTDPFQARLAAKFAVQDLGATSAAVLYDVASDYSRGIYETFRRFFEAAGGRVVAAETYTSGEVDFAAQLESIRGVQPEVLFLPINRVELLPQLRQTRAMGIDATFLGVDAWLPETLTEQPEAEGAFVTTHWHPALAETRDRARTFLEDFRRAYGREPESFAALTTDACDLLFHAITEAGSDEPRAIRDRLAAIENFPGVTGPITFRGTGGDPPKPVAIVRIRAGEVVFHQLVSP